METGKTGKYFQYAIGEIVLVVIGILIALQINNWNLSKQDAIFERKIIFELKKTIESDLDGFKESEKRIIRKDQAIDSILMHRNKLINLSEKELRKHHIRVGLGILLSYDKAVFETLKNSGLQKINSDTLKKVITRFYEVNLPRYHEFVDDNYNYYKPLSLELLKKLKQIRFYEDFFQTSKNSKGYYIRRKYDFSKIHSEEYKNYLLLHANYKLDDWYRVKSLIKKTEGVLDLINKEIEQRYKD